jgi:hypothetical protein
VGYKRKMGYPAGKKRAEALAKDFGVHPAITMFPEYEAKDVGKAS